MAIAIVIIVVVLTIENIVLTFYLEDRLASIKTDTECIWTMCLKLICYCCAVNPKVMEKIYQDELNGNINIKPIIEKEETCQEN